MALDAVSQEEWEKHLMATALERVKQQVSPRQFQMFDLHVLQKLSVQETARTLQASLASVYMAKHHVARLVTQEIRKPGGDGALKRRIRKRSDRLKVYIATMKHAAVTFIVAFHCLAW